MQDASKLIIAFDFDQTILKTHSISQNWTPDQVANFTIHQIYRATSELFNNEVFIADLKKWKQNNQVRYVITSYGYREVIDIYLKRIGLHHLFDLILTPQAFDLLDGFNVVQELDGKNAMLKEVQQLLSTNRVILVDDSFENIQRAKREKFLTHQVEAQIGLTIKDGDKIRTLINQNI